MSGAASDRDALLDLVAAYSHHADALDTRRWAEFFTEDGVFTIVPWAPAGEAPVPIVWQGRAAIAAALEPRHAALRRAREQRRHLLTNVLVLDQTPTTARVEAYLQLVASVDGGAPGLVGTGRYAGRAVKNGAGWRMAAWTLHADQRMPGGLPAHD